jgi:signal transduction histidine kinase
MEIEQVILNLVKNAVHAMTDNPDPHDSPHLTIRTSREEEAVYIEVEDNGPGINEEIIQNIFDPFFTTKGIGVGTGLGLSVSYTIINEKHGGRIWVESEPGKGATFKIKLPAGQIH